MFSTAPSTRTRRAAACVAFAIALGIAGCSSSDASSLSVADLNAGTADELDLRDGLFSQLTAEDLNDDTALSAAEVALYQTLATVYFSDELQRAFVLQALDDWEATASSLRTRRTQPDDTDDEIAARDRSIDEFRQTLERAAASGDALDVDVFLQLPAVDRMIVELESGFGSSGLDDVG